jgi:hypothetical protein
MPGLPLAVGRGRVGLLQLLMQLWGAMALKGLLLAPALLLLPLLVLAVVVLQVLLPFVFAFLSAPCSALLSYPPVLAPQDPTW